MRSMAGRCSLKIRDQANPLDAVESILLHSETGLPDVLPQAISPSSRASSGCCHDGVMECSTVASAPPVRASPHGTRAGH
jgi:hypothetical protein